MPYKLLLIRIIILILLSAFKISYAQNNEDHLVIKDLYDNAGHFNNTGKYSLAIKTLKQAIILRETTNTDTPPEYFKIYNRLGNVYMAQGNLQQAIEYYTKALQHTSDSYNRSLIIDNIVTVYSLKGDYLKAIDFYENSIAILQKSKKKDKYSKIIENYHNQGYAYNQLHNYQAAKSKFLKSILIAEQNNLNDIADIYYNCGLAYKRLDSLDLAEYYFTNAVNINLKIYGKNHIKTTMSYLYLADFYAKIGKFTQASPIFNAVYTKLLATVGEKHPYTADYHKFVSDMYFSMGKYKQALEYCQQSIVSKVPEFNDNSIYKNPSLNSLPDIELLEILKRKGRTLVKLAAQENKESNLKAALNTFELTVKFIEQVRKSYLYENSKLILAEKEHETYMSIISISYDLMNITGDSTFAHTAFKYSEHSKYAILRESINEETARNLASIPDSISTEERKIKEQLELIRKQINDLSKNIYPDTLLLVELKNKHFQLTQKHETIIKSFERDYPKYYKRKYDNHFVSISKLQSILSTKEVFVSYEFTDSSLYTFIVTDKEFEFTCKPINNLFHKDLKYYGKFLHSEFLLPYDSFRISAYELYKTMVEPISVYLNNKNLLIAPNSQMSQIAFESLVTEPYQKQVYADYRTVPYLIRKYPIGYAHSATLLVNSKLKKKKYNPRFLGFAPDYKDYRDSLNYIPQVPKNLRKIARLFRSKIFTKEEATEQALKENIEDFGIIHIYAYGYEDEQNPSFSKIFFSFKNDTIEDGYLYAYEIDGLQNNAELIVLASCFSGSGKINKGEGAISIGRSFMTSGNPSIIFSLWAAYIEPTLFELDIFYKHLVLGKRKDEALRLAKLKYLEKTDDPVYTHPKFWTSLVVVGNQDALFKAYLVKVCLLSLLPISILFLLFIIIRKRIK